MLDTTERRYDLLLNSKAPFKDYTDPMAVVIQAYRAQRKVLPAASSPSLSVMLTAAGL